MTDRRAASLATQPRARAPVSVSQWPLNLSPQELLIDGLWILFFIGATTALNKAAGVNALERLFWFPAYLAVAALIFPMQTQFVLLARKNAILMTWPLLACISAMWSFTPNLSFYHGIQLLMTIAIGFLLFIYADLTRLLQITFSALLICSALSLTSVLLQPTQSTSVIGEWQGSFAHKNSLGNLMALQIITGVCLFFHGWRRFLSLVGTVLAAFLLIFSRSATALVSLVVTMMAIPLALALRNGIKTFLIVLVAILWVSTLGAFILVELDIHVVRSLLLGLGKEETLSSRTLLWHFAFEAFEQRPWLGYGFKAYWASLETSADILRYEVGQALWFFHNVFLESAVAFGIAGPLLFTAGLLYALKCNLRLVTMSRGFVGFWPFLFTVLSIVQCFGEYPLFVNHSLSQLLLAATVATPWRHLILDRGRSTAQADNNSR